MRRLSLRGRGDAELLAATLDGDFIQGDIQGPMNLEGWSGPIQEALASGGFAPASAPFHNVRDWSVDLTLLRDDLLERWSAGTQSVGPGSRWTGSYVDGTLETRLNLTGLHIDALRTGPLDLALEGGTTALHVGLEVHGIRHAQAGRVEHLTVDAAVSTGTESDILVEWDATLSGRIMAEHRMEKNGVHKVHFEDVSLLHDTGPWGLDTTHLSRFQWDGTDWTSLNVEEFILKGPLGKSRAHQEAPWVTINVPGRMHYFRPKRTCDHSEIMIIKRCFEYK